MTPDPNAKAYTLLGPDRRPYLSPTPGTLGGHKRGRRYGRLDCPAALRTLARGGYVRNRVFFADEETAIAAKYRSCAVCLPERYSQWKAQARDGAERIWHSPAWPRAKLVDASGAVPLFGGSNLSTRLHG